MKKIAAVFIILLLGTRIFGVEALDDFMGKAKNADKSIRIKQAQYDAIKAEYEAVSKKIDAVKSIKTSNPISSFINSIKLNFFLGQGNNLGYRSFTLGRELNSIKEDYFTFSMLVIDEYSKKVKDCAAIKCADLKSIFDAREEWVKATGAFESFYRIDAAPEMLLENMTTEAKKDLVEYLKRKLVQMDERLYMLKEEKEIIGLVKNAGIKVSDMMNKDVEREIRELALKKSALSESVKRIK